MDSAAVDTLVEKARESFGIPGVAVAIVTGSKSYVQGYGSKELGKCDPVTADTLFAVGSVTKAFTTTAIAMLTDDGKMSWDDHPRKYVPGFKLHDPLADANVTMRDLVAHRTGLARHDCLWYNSLWTSQELLSKIPHLPLTFSFRSTYQYNNLMYMIAGLAIEQASGVSWHRFIRSRILKPLGMTRTVTSVCDLASAGDYCTPHEKKEEEVVPFVWCNVDNVAACGGINSCARDMAKWVQFQLAGGRWRGRDIISRERLAETHAPHMVVPVDDQSRDLAETTLTSYCLGWNLMNYRDWTIVAHGGSIDGFNAGVALAPKAGVGVAVLSNLCSDSTVWAIRNALLDHLLGLQPKDWNNEVLAMHKKNAEKRKKDEEERAAKRVPGTSPSLEPIAYTGDFHDDGYGSATVTLDGDDLLLAWNNHRARLAHFHFDTFIGKYEPPDWPVPIEVLFGLAADGTVGNLKLIWPNSSTDHVFRKARE